MKYNQASLNREIVNFRNAMCNASQWDENGQPKPTLMKAFGFLITGLLQDFEGTQQEKEQAEILIDSHATEFRRRMELMLGLAFKRAFAKV